jgi:phage/plasmid-associated DNA primase
MWSSMNVFQDFYDDSDGMIRRLNLFDFPNQFEGEKEDPHLADKLTRPDELAGLFNMLMPRLKRIIETGSLQMAKKTIAERRDQVRLARDPVDAFIEDMFQEGATASDMTEKKEVYSTFERWCKEKKVPTISEEAFGRAMKAKGYQDKRLAGKRYWQGVLLLSQPKVHNS